MLIVEIKFPWSNFILVHNLHAFLLKLQQGCERNIFQLFIFMCTLRLFMFATLKFYNLQKIILKSFAVAYASCRSTCEMKICDFRTGKFCSGTIKKSLNPFRAHLLQATWWKWIRKSILSLMWHKNFVVEYFEMNF